MGGDLKSFNVQGGDRGDIRIFNVPINARTTSDPIPWYIKKDGIMSLDMYRGGF